MSIHMRLSQNGRDRRRRGKGQECQTLVINLGKVRHAFDHGDWVGMKPRFAIVKMLDEVKGCVPDEWFGVDDQPRFPLGPQDICSVKVSGEQFISRRWFGKLLK